MSLDELTRTREKYRSRAFGLAIGIIFLFGVPALGAFFGGRALDRLYSSGNRYQLILLGIAFVLSWTIFFMRWRVLDRELQAADKAIAEEMSRRREKGGLLRPIREDTKEF